MSFSASLRSHFTIAVCINILLALHRSLAQSLSPTPTSTSILTQPIIHPGRRDVLNPGTTFTIQWNANPHFSNVTIQLWDKTSWGFARDLLSPCIPWARNPFCGTIAMHAPNTGNFSWQIPNPQNGSLGFGFPRDERVWWIKMYVEDYVQTDIGNKDPVLSYSQNFVFAKDGEPGTIVSNDVTSTIFEPDGPGTVYVTVHKSATLGLGATGVAGTAASVTATAIPGKNDTVSLPSEGSASRLKKSVLGALLILFGFI